MSKLSAEVITACEVPYALSSIQALAGEEVRVLLYRNPEGGVSVQIETEDAVQLRVMVNDEDLHDGPVS